MAIKTKKGRMHCETCGTPVTVKVNDKDTLSYRCDECDAAPYARAGTGQHSNWLSKMEVFTDGGQKQTKQAEKKPAKIEDEGLGAGFF